MALEILSFEVIPRRGFFGIGKSKAECFTVPKARNEEIINTFQLSTTSLQKIAILSINGCEYPFTIRMVNIDRSKVRKLEPTDLQKRVIIQFSWKSYPKTQSAIKKYLSESYSSLASDSKFESRIVKFSYGGNRTFFMEEIGQRIGNNSESGSFSNDEFLTDYSKQEASSQVIDPQPIYWWSNKPTEKYWLEISDRSDLGANLHAPQTNQSGNQYWSYSFVTIAKKGDIVYHYSKKKKSIVSYSIIQEDSAIEEELKWAARGSYAKGLVPYRRAGWLRKFSEHYILEDPLTLEELKTRIVEITQNSSLLLTDKPKKKGHYFPFELKSSRPMRPMQGYMFKLPKFLLEIFPKLMVARQVDVPKRKDDYDPNESGVTVRLL